MKTKVASGKRGWPSGRNLTEAHRVAISRGLRRFWNPKPKTLCEVFAEEEKRKTK